VDAGLFQARTKRNMYHARFLVLIAVKIQFKVFWVVKLCNVVVGMRVIAASIFKVKWSSEL
jgi:hypothetical protein